MDEGLGHVTGLLLWSDDEWSEYSENEDAIVAEDGDRKFHIWPVRGDDDEIFGYRIEVGNLESGYRSLGSAEIQGDLGELTLHGAKAAAEAEVQSQLEEVNVALKALVSDWKDRAGNPRIRFDATGAMFYPVDESGDVEIRIFAGTDYEDRFDPAERSWMVGWDNLFNHSDSLESLLQQQIAEHAAALGISGR